MVGILSVTGHEGPRPDQGRVDRRPRAGIVHRAWHHDRSSIAHATGTGMMVDVASWIPQLALLENSIARYLPRASRRSLWSHDIHLLHLRTL